jgi:hypothetical protein
MQAAPLRTLRTLRTLREQTLFGATAHRSLLLSTVWCGQEDSNFHGLSPTTTSTLRVYQFRHGRMPVTSSARPLASRPWSRNLHYR